MSIEAEIQDYAATRKRCLGCIAGVLDILPVRIKDTDTIYGGGLPGDLCGDELCLVELTMALENEFGIEIPDGDDMPSQETTVGGLIAYVVRRLDEKP